MDISRIGGIPVGVAPAGFGKFIAEARRYPLIPMFILVVLLVFPAITAQWIAPHDPYKVNPRERLTPPAWSVPQYFEGVEVRPAGSWENILGTDKLGRDVLSRIMHGARYSLSISLLAILAGGVIGSGLGVLAGYFGGMLDHVVMRLVDIFITIPGLLFALVLAIVLGPSFSTIVLVVAVILWPRFARMSRAETLSMRSRDFVSGPKFPVAPMSSMLRQFFPTWSSPVVWSPWRWARYLLEATLSFPGSRHSPAHAQG